jgi:heme exporter protein C
MRMLRVGRWITAIALLLLAGVYVRALAFTPVEASQGLAQKIFYLHVPAAIWAETAIILTGLGGIFFLFLKDPRLDRFAASSAEVGAIFAAIVLTTGPIWGKPIWGTWWTWDARLTFTLFLFLLYVGYLVLRDAIADPAMRARYSAVIGICGMCLVPFIHFSVYMFPTLHPMPIVLQPGRPKLPGSMLTTWLFSLAVFTLLYVGFVVQRYALSYLREQLEAAGEVGHA